LPAFVREATEAEVLGAILKRNLSVREAERLAARNRAPQRPRARKSADVRALQERLSRALGTKVEVTAGRGKGSGTISIAYGSLEELDRLLELLEKR
jgi:ParB family chromosome partitioning protein